MIPGMNMNSRDMKMMMRRMGIQQQDIDDAIEVLIRCKSKDIVIQNPQVSKVNMMGQQTWQVVGEAVEKARDATPDISEDDIKTVMEQTGSGREEAVKAIKETKGDLAEAILKLQDR